MYKKKANATIGKESSDQARKDMGKYFLQQISLRHSVGLFTKGKWMPATDVYETDCSFVITIELSGVKRNDISIVLENNRLVITGERKEIANKKLETYYQVEINYGCFERIIFLPESIEEGKIAAEYDNGFLTITIPKKIASGKTKNIQVNIA
ncbi:MAG: Hsp20/alpha crystallin family protein [bacterium]